MASGDGSSGAAAGTRTGCSGLSSFFFFSIAFGVFWTKVSLVVFDTGVMLEPAVAPKPLRNKVFEAGKCFVSL